MAVIETPLMQQWREIKNRHPDALVFFRVLQGVTGPQFDATYMDAQIGAHQYALRGLDRMIAQGGVTDEMLEIMRATRASVAQHLEQAQAIRGRLQ